MKYLIYILLLILSVTACAQGRKVSGYPAATDPDANDILYFIEDGASKNITKSLLQQSLTDDITTLTGDVSDLNDSIIVLRGLINNLFVEVNLIWDTIDYFHGDTPPSSAPWVDSITMLAYTDWNDVAEQTNPTYETVTDPFGNLNFVGGEIDVPPKDGIFQTFAITDIGGGDMVLESIFLEDACCLEQDLIGPGTAGYWEFAFTESDDQYQDVWFDYMIKFEDGFTIAAGTKTPGVINTTHNSPQRMMLLNTAEDDVFQWQWYSDVFSDDNDNDPERSASTGWGLDGITLTTDQWYRITQRYYSTSSGDDGFHYLFIDNILVAKRTGMRFNSSPTTTSHWDAGDQSRFMGGDTDTYSADHDESHFTNNESYFIINDDVTTITEGETLDLGYDISDILEGVDTFHDN